MRPFMTRAEMSEYKFIIKKVFSEFEKSYKKKMKNTNGVVTIPMMNKIFEKAKGKFKLTQEQDNAAEAFFDTYIGHFTAVCNSDQAKDDVFLNVFGE